MCQLKNYSAAIEVFTEGKEFVYDNKPFLAQFYANIGDAQNQLKNHAASDSAYDMALEIDPNNVYVLNNYAYYLSLRNINLDKAEKMSKKSNELEPNNNSYQDTYGWILFKQNKTNEAIKVLESAYRAQPTESVIAEHLGDAYWRVGRTLEARFQCDTVHRWILVWRVCDNIQPDQ